jgi:hypothetical protein
MQTPDKRKQNLNDLSSNYRPLGPRDLLAAALAMRPREEAEEERAERGAAQRNAA